MVSYCFFFVMRFPIPGKMVFLLKQDPVFDVLTSCMRYAECRNTHHNLAFMATSYLDYLVTSTFAFFLQCDFTFKLIETYSKLKDTRKDFEVIFVSSDEDDGGFDACYKDMPWLALPCEDEWKDDLDTHFDIQGICNRLVTTRPVITRTTCDDKGTCASILAHTKYSSYSEESCGKNKAYGSGWGYQTTLARSYNCPGFHYYVAYQISPSYLTGVAIASPQFSCGGTCNMWTWFKGSKL